MKNYSTLVASIALSFELENNMIKNILQSLFKLIIGAGPFGALSVFVILMITGVGQTTKFVLYWR